MTTFFWAVIFVIGSYLIGSIPTGLLVGLYGYGVDIRKQGSGNLGATNALRALGGGAGIIVLAGDILKGFMAVTIAGLFFPGAPIAIHPNPEHLAVADALVVVAAAMAAMIGNNYSVYLKFQGGKGIGITTGLILAIAPKIALILFIIWVTVILISRYVSLASLVIALFFPVLMYYFYGFIWPYVLYSILAAILAVFSHRSNIRRLLNGSELKVGAQSREELRVER